MSSWKLAKQNQCLAQMLDDVRLIRRQHENLADRRRYARSLHDDDEEAVKGHAAAVMEKQRKEFENSEAQTVQREYQKTELGPCLGFGGGYNIYIYIYIWRLLICYVI